MKVRVLSGVLTTVSFLGGAAYSENSEMTCAGGDNISVQSEVLSWPMLRTLEDVDDAIFGKAQCLNDAFLLLTWLENNGASVVGPLPYSQEAMRSYGYSGPAFLVSATFKRGEIPFHFGFFQMLGVDTLSVGVFIDEHGVPIRVRSTLSRV